MNRLLRRGATMVAATMTAALLLPGAAAQAVPNITPCDNETTATSNTIVIPLLTNGFVIVQIDAAQDIYVQVDGPGETFDTEVGADVQTLTTIGDHDTVCVLLPVVGGFWVSVDLVPLHVQVCTFRDQPWVATGCPLP